MRPPLDIPLCDYDSGDGHRRLSARLDEMTLTYCVVELDHEGRVLSLKRHVLSLREARRWATAYRDERLRATDPRAPTGGAAHSCTRTIHGANREPMQRRRHVPRSKLREC